MKYNGKELIEMTPEKWDGKSRRMLTWNDDDKTWSVLICGYNPLSKSWICADSSICFSHCAEMEIPKEESKYDFVENMLKTATQAQNDCIILPKRAVEQMREMEKAFGIVYEENEKLKTEVNELKNSCSYQVYSDMCNEKVKLEEENRKIKEKLAAGFLCDKACDLFKNKLNENAQAIESMKKTRRMTNKELFKWLAQGNGAMRWSNNERAIVTAQFTYDVFKEDYTVASGIIIRGWNETEWHEPLIEE